MIQWQITANKVLTGEMETGLNEETKRQMASEMDATVVREERGKRDKRKSTVQRLLALS